MLLAACGDDGGSTPDAPPQHLADARVFLDAPVDAGPPSVMMVTCPNTPDGVVATTGTGAAAMYSPKITMIHVGQVVKFVTTATHDVQPVGSIACPTCVADTGLTVDFAKTECLEFTKPANFGFICSNHGFTGQIDVAP